MVRFDARIVRLSWMRREESYLGSTWNMRVVYMLHF